MDPKKQRYRRIRGLILKLLAFEHPGTIDAVLLRFLLDDLKYPTSQEEFDSHVAYLAYSTKGYLVSETKSSGGVKITHITITPKGLDLIDKFTAESDPGVDVDHL